MLVKVENTRFYNDKMLRQTLPQGG